MNRQKRDICWISYRFSPTKIQGFPNSQLPFTACLIKVVRIFTSSTFTDMLMERNTLMEWVYPKIKEYCKEKHGLEFQVCQSRVGAPWYNVDVEVVDMRWGVRDEMTNEHATTALCVNELRGCQKFSMGPNFIYFGGQKYGYRCGEPNTFTEVSVFW